MMDSEAALIVQDQRKMWAAAEGHSIRGSWPSTEDGGRGGDTEVVLMGRLGLGKQQ